MKYNLIFNLLHQFDQVITKTRSGPVIVIRCKYSMVNICRYACTQCRCLRVCHCSIRLSRSHVTRSRRVSGKPLTALIRTGRRSNACVHYPYLALLPHCAVEPWHVLRVRSRFYFNVAHSQLISSWLLAYQYPWPFWKILH